jgi:hypothetical protein
MAITITWATKVINVPKADTTLVDIGPPEIRSLDMDAFRLTLKDLEDDVEGMPFDDTHNHVPPITVGTITLARVVEIINGYTVTFEDGQYSVDLQGANTNLQTEVNRNQVGVFTNNSAGLIAEEQLETQMDEMHRLHGLGEGKTLEVSPDKRTVKDGLIVEISQTVSSVDNKTTVTRDP